MHQESTTLQPGGALIASMQYDWSVAGQFASQNWNVSPVGHGGGGAAALAREVEKPILELRSNAQQVVNSRLMDPSDARGQTLSAGSTLNDRGHARITNGECDRQYRNASSR
jgi:hypothetical protein